MSTQDSVANNDQLHGFHLNNYCVKKQEVINSINEVGGFVQITMDELRSSGSADDMEAHDNIVSTIANFLLHMVVGISKVCTERDNWNGSEDQLPPVLPPDLCAGISRDFVSCMQQQRSRLRQKFSDEDVEKIDEPFRKLHLALRSKVDFHKCCKMQHFNHLNIIGVHSEAIITILKLEDLFEFKAVK
jgi:hypothetical protein